MEVHIEGIICHKIHTLKTEWKHLDVFQHMLEYVGTQCLIYLFYFAFKGNNLCPLLALLQKKPDSDASFRLSTNYLAFAWLLVQVLWLLRIWLLTDGVNGQVNIFKYNILSPIFIWSWQNDHYLCQLGLASVPGVSRHCCAPGGTQGRLAKQVRSAGGGECMWETAFLETVFSETFLFYGGVWWIRAI